MVDLNKLEKNLDEALNKETKESLNEFLNNQRMISAKIIETSDKVMVKGNRLPEPDPEDYVIGYDYEHEEYCYDEYKWKKDYQIHKESEFIAEVENVTRGNEKGLLNEYWFYIEKQYFLLSLNQSCFIEPTTEGKCKIVKI